MPNSIIRVAVAIVFRDTLCLVAKRRPDAHLGGLWEFPGGRCKSGEGPREAALRELREECGIDADAERTLDPVVHEYPERHVEITPVLCRWRAGEAQALENAGCNWVSVAELRELEMPAVNARIIRQLEVML